MRTAYGEVLGPPRDSGSPPKALPRCYALDMSKMRNAVIALSLLTLAAEVVAQKSSPFNRFNFAGVKWLSTRNEVKNVMASKGYKFKGTYKEVFSPVDKYDAEDQFYTGNVVEENADIYTWFNHEGRLVRLQVVIPLEENEIFSKYYGTVNSLKAKYGKPDKEVERYDAPYSKGDSFQALAIGKAAISTTWFTENDSLKRYEMLDVELDRKMFMRITYSSQYYSAEYLRRNSGGGDDL